MNKENEELKMEILRQYEIDLKEYKRVHKEYQRYLRHLPVSLNKTQEMERAYRKVKFSDDCKLFFNRREYHRKRLNSIGVDIKLNSESVGTEEIHESYRQTTTLRQKILVLRATGSDDNDIMQRLGCTTEELKQALSEEGELK